MLDFILRRNIRKAIQSEAAAHEANLKRREAITAVQDATQRGDTRSIGKAREKARLATNSALQAELRA